MTADIKTIELLMILMSEHNVTRVKVGDLELTRGTGQTAKKKTPIDVLEEHAHGNPNEEAEKEEQELAEAWSMGGGFLPTKPKLPRHQ